MQTIPWQRPQLLPDFVTFLRCWHRDIAGFSGPIRPEDLAFGEEQERAAIANCSKGQPS